MKQVWLVGYGEYSYYSVEAVCSSYEQAEGVAAVMGEGTYAQEQPIELWEPEDGIPPHRLLHTCLVRDGRDSARPVDVSFETTPVGLDQPNPKTRVSASAPGYNYRWAKAEFFPTAKEAEEAARLAYSDIVTKGYLTTV